MIFSSIPDLSLLRFENEINENGSKDSVSPNDVPAAKDDLLELAKKIQTEYADLFADIKQNDPLLAALKTKSDDYSSLYGNTGKLQGPFNTIKALFVTSALYDYDADLSLTSNGLKNLIASNGNLNSNVGDDADKLSIVPVANSAKVYYKYGTFEQILVLESKVNVYYSTNQSWLLFLRIPCTPILKNGKVYLELFSVPQFTTENNEPFDPFGFVNIAKRVDSRSQYIDSIKKVLSSFATDLVDINFASIDFKLTPKNIILDDRLGVLSNTNGTIKARPMEHLTFNSSKAVVRISNDYTNQLLGEAFQERLGGNGTVVFMRGSSSQNPGSLTINIQIAHFEKRDNIFLFPDVEVRVNVYCTYFLYFLNQANNVSALRGTMLNYSYDINIDNLPPFYNADSDMNQIVDQIKAQVARELYFEKAFNTQNAQYPRVALTFESGELEILLNK